MIALLRFLQTFVGDAFPTPLLIVIGVVRQDAGLILLAIVWNFLQYGLLGSTGKATLGGQLIGFLLWLVALIVYVIHGPLP